MLFRSGKSVTKFDVQKYKGTKDWFMKEIEERLRERAGNLPLKDSYQYTKETVTREEPKQPAKEIIYGEGLTEKDIQKIIEEFE